MIIYDRSVGHTKKCAQCELPLPPHPHLNALANQQDHRVGAPGVFPHPNANPNPNPNPNPTGGEKLPERPPRSACTRWFMDNSPTNQLADNQLADRPTRRQTRSN